MKARELSDNIAEEKARVWVRIVGAVDTAVVERERARRLALSPESAAKLRMQHATLCRWAILDDKKRVSIDHGCLWGAFSDRPNESLGCQPDLLLVMML